MEVNNGNESDSMKKIEKQSNLFSPVILIKHPLLFKQYFSPSQRPDEGLLKPIHFNIDFQS